MATDKIVKGVSLAEKLARLYNLRLHAPRSSLDDRSAYRELLQSLGDPHKKLPPLIHVAGTNGKGSTLAFLRAMYEAEGYRVHTYTSPHLIRFNERIRLQGKEIEDDLLETMLDEITERAAGLQLTFFEITTALAFLAFSRSPADLCLLETGMGGRLDCTNIIEKPLASIITRISLDHRQYLGQTIQDIAREKAGIMKPGAPCIISYQSHGSDASASHDSETLPFDSISGQIGTPLHRAGHEWTVSTLESDPDHFLFRYGAKLNRYPMPKLVGAHQLENAGAALACTHVIDSLSIHEESRKAGLTRVKWPARLQRLDGHPLREMIPPSWEIWLDGGHNDSAGQALAQQAQWWHTHDPRPLHVIIGIKSDKEADLFLTPLAQHADSLTIVPIPGMEGGSHDQTSLQVLKINIPENREIAAAPSVAAALKQVQQLAPVGAARVLIAGSLYLAGAILGQGQEPA